MIYEPQEDSFLLKSCIPKDLANKKVLEIGCGSGILSDQAQKNGADVIAVDINPEAVVATKKLNKNIAVLQGDLFQPVKNLTFDLIICNPPYLPDEPKDPDIALDGGKEGWEFIQRFLINAKLHLSEKGYILLLYSNRTKEEQVHKIIFDQGYRRFPLESKAVGLGEILYVDELRPYLAKGKRGFTYTEASKGKLILVKEHRPDIQINTIENEANFLKILNKHHIGPKFISYKNNQLRRVFIDGLRIDEYLKKASKKDTCNIISQVLQQCRTMDSLGINKQEMTNPYKHILIENKIAYMIDFERCRKTLKPKNVTQFIQYLVKLHDLFSEKGLVFKQDYLLDLATDYKHNNYDEAIFKKILKVFS